MQVRPERICRCWNCGYKTHHRFWKNKQCPICGSTDGYGSSRHGGLTETKMKEAKELLLLSKKS